MKTKILGLLAAGLLTWSVAAQAERLSVNISADYQLAPLFPEPGTLTLAFSVVEPLTNVVAESDFAFRLSDLQLNVVLNGAAGTNLVNTVGWFAYQQPLYRGIDLRLSSLLTEGDVMQVILVTPVALYSGTTAAPTLERLNLSNLFGAICYYGAGSTSGCDPSGQVINGSYSMTPVPESGTLALLGLGLAGLGLSRRRKAN